MTEINAYVGTQIRKYRKACGMTLQQLADAIHKSRATVCKYERGEITLDVETLYELSQVLQISVSQLTSYYPKETAADREQSAFGGVQKNPFFQAKRLYFYFYDGRYKRLKDGLIDILDPTDQPGIYRVAFTVCSVSDTGRSSEIYYTGTVLYSDMLIRFSFVNQYNPLEEDLLYIFNPLEMRDYTDGLLCGISSTDLMPCAFKCVVTLTPQEHTEALRKRLLFSARDLKKWEEVNMLLIDNRN